ncbi:hypothetical protein HPP92_019901 [Vanilla planifolia]|uniref:Dof-type domain-containing protein n=1 Tax=Vanilla planifolia TaxID=51239 RepID=A0A835Q6M5_VANPL|nr:hypothetical protein HPP92_019901 [Vanilla planifolia]
MQDFQSITGLRGRILEGSGGHGVGGTEHRLRGFPSSSMTGAPHPPPALKCPRCESSNTKFCYYNNYNPLSRVTSASLAAAIGPKEASSATSPSAGDAASPNALPPPNRPPNPLPPTPLHLLPLSQIKIPNLVSPPPPAADIFADSAVTFPSLVAAAAVANQSIQGFNFVDPPLLRLPDPPPAPPQHPKLEEVRVQGLLHATDLPELPSVGGIDWPAVDSGIFDLSGSTDPATYWNHSHWSDGDPSLYLP